MADYQIFSDGACDIGFAKAEEWNIHLIPFYVSIDHETYQKELFELPLDTYYRAITEEKCYPKTSLPSIQDYMDAFRPTLEEGKDILCVTMTRTLTASMESAMTARTMLLEDFPNANIHILDSWLATGAQALLLHELSRMQRDGKSLEDAIAFVEKAKQDARIHFIVGDLSYLEIGGRIGKVAALSGSLLKIKPIIILKDGEIGVGGICRSRKKGLSHLIDLTAKHFQETGETPADYYCTVGTTTIWEDIPAMEAALKEKLPFQYLPAFQIGATIATHTGPGTTGICFLKKYEAYGF